MRPDEHWMQRALTLAAHAETLAEVPVGAVIVLNDEIIGQGFNQPIAQNDATAHAEINAIRSACLHQQNYRLPGATLYVTLEPCAMCAGAIIHARIARVVFAATEPKTGAAGSCCDLFNLPGLNHTVQCEGGILAMQSGDMLRQFFRQRRSRAG